MKREGLLDVPARALVGMRAGEGAAQVTQLREQQRRPGIGAGDLDEPVNGLGGQLAHERGAREARDRILGVHVHGAEAGGRHRGEGVDHRAERPQRAEHVGPLRLGARVAGAHHHQVLPPQRLGHVRERRHPHHQGERGHLVGHALHPLAPGVEHLGGACHREDQVAGVDLGHRDEVDLQPGHDGVVAPAALQRPVEVRLALGVGPQAPPVGRHHLEGAHAVGRDPVAASQPAEPAAQHVAGHADVRSGPRQAGQTLARRRPLHVAPAGAGAQAREPGSGVHLHVRQRAGAEEHHVVQVPARRVPGGLRHDAQPVVPGEPDGGRHVVGAGHLHHGRRMLIDPHAPRPAGPVPGRSVAGPEDRAADRPAKAVEVEGR